MSDAQESAVAENTETETSTTATSTDETSTGESTEKTVTEEVAKAAPVVPYEPIAVTLKNLLHAGTHYGHQARRWNPKMMKYIYAERNDVHIINLDQTLEHWKRAEKFLENITNRGGTVLFVGTKPQARNIVKAAAERSGAFYVIQRWLGGTLSNFETVKRSIRRMKKLEELLDQANAEDTKVKISKKERLNISRQIERLEANLGGIRNMKHLPDALFIVDINRESIAVNEARKLHIPVIALVDTNVDPTVVDYPIPANDDATKSINLLVNGAADAVQRGREAFLSRGPEPRGESGEPTEVVSRKKKGGARGGKRETSKNEGNGVEEQAATVSSAAAN